MSVPKLLNGYAVVWTRTHSNGYVTVMVERDDATFIVATWWKELGSTWQWGHYDLKRADADVCFEGVAERNRKRGVAA